MNLSKHFESYRASLRKDALDGFDEYASIVGTAKPDRFPKVIDYLKYAFQCTSSAVKSVDEQGYKAWVVRHQEAMIALFDRMVGDHLWDYENTTPEDLFDMIQRLGWNWYKFCRLPILFKLRTGLNGGPDKLLDMVFIPRYAPEFKNKWGAKDLIVLDADEGSIFFDGTKTPKFTHPVIEFKMAHPGQKLLRVDVAGKENQCYYKPVAAINDADVVVDWSLPLF